MDASPNRDTDGAFTQLVLFFLVTAAMLIGAEACVSRNAVMTVAALKLYGVVLALICSVSLVWRYVPSLQAAFLAGTGYLLASYYVGTPWLLLPLIAGGVTSLAFLRWRQVLRTVLKIELWVGAAVVAALVMSVLHYGDFLVLEKLGEGTIHQDTLFHASIAGMLKTYGVASTGVNGLAPVPYHVLSHELVAALSILSGVRVLEIYGVFEIVFLCPLLVLAVTWAAWEISSRGSSDRVIRLWLVVAAVLVVMELLPLAKFAAWDSYFVSEGYTLALVYFVLALPTAASANPTLPSFSIACVLMLLAGLSNGAVGAVGMAMLWAKVLVAPGAVGRLVAGAVAAVTTVAFAYGILAGAERTANVSPFNPFFYVQLHSWWRDYVKHAVRLLRLGRSPGGPVLSRAALAVTCYLLVNFALSWAVLARRLSAGGARAMFRQADGLFTLVAVAIGLVALMFEILGVWYFVNIAMFVSFPFFAAMLSRPGERRLGISRVLLMLSLLAGVSWLLVDGYRTQGGIFWKSRAFVGRTAFPSADPQITVLMSMRHVDQGAPVVFQAAAEFPKVDERRWYCAQIPLLYPAVTERAWAGVVDATSKCPFSAYGYPSYFAGDPRVLLPPVIPAGVKLARVTSPATHRP